jgi:hypothetical protein
MAMRQLSEGFNKHLRSFMRNDTSKEAEAYFPI